MKGLFATALGLAMGAVALGENVAHLGDSDFDDHVAAHKYVLAEFYAPWCGHCKQLAPEYEKAATHFKDVEVEGGLSIVAVDATEHKELATRFGVQGFPTLKWIVNGKDSEYGGGRTEDEIVSWVTKKTGPPAKQIDDDAALTAFKESADVTVFGYFSDQSSDAAKKFLEVAETMDDAPFGISSSVSAGLDDGSVVVYRSFEGEEPEVKCGDDIEKCVSGNLLPLIVPFSQANAPKIFGGAIKQHVLVFLDMDAHKDTVMSAIRPVATAKKGEYLFVTVDKSDDRILEFFGLGADDLPTARVVEMLDSGMKKFAFSEDFTEANLQAFVDSHAAGTLEQDLKSEADIPDEEQPKDGNVWVLVGKNHDRIAFDNTKNVLVEYYAPWCGHCKKLAPEYEKVGEHYKDDDTVIIAKMDSTANEVAKVQIQGFPTLKFFPAGSDDIVDFDGGRDEEGIKKFLEENKK
jgi:protein disulfide-isomerase A1